MSSSPTPGSSQTSIGAGERSIETVTVTVLNTRFGDALQHPKTLDRILPTNSAGRLALVGFSEITPGVRSQAVAAIQARGYEAVVPEGAGSNVDTVWAVSPGLAIVPETTTAHPFPGHIASRPGARQKRDAGMHTVIATTPGGRRIRASTERLAPPVRGKGARIAHLGHMATLLDQHTPPDPSVDVDVNGGDQNHANGPTAADKALWRPRGFTPVLVEGTPTYTLENAGRTAKAIAGIAHVLNRTPSMHFDEMYLRAGPDRELVPTTMPTDDILPPGHIGYAAEVVPVDGTDHQAIETTLNFY